MSAKHSKTISGRPRKRAERHTMFFSKLQQTIIADLGRKNRKYKFFYGKTEDNNVVIVVDGYTAYRIPERDFALSFDFLEKELNQKPLNRPDALFEMNGDYVRVQLKNYISDSRYGQLAIYANENDSVKVTLNEKLYTEFMKEFKDYDLVFYAKDDKSPVFIEMLHRKMTCVLPVRLNK